MEWRKVKNIIIVILLLVNGFLLVIVGSRWDEMRRYERSALHQAAQVLNSNGIEVDLASLVSAEELPMLTAERDVTLESKLAEVLLGEELQRDNQGGGLYTYRSDMGTVNIRSGGQINARLSEKSRWKTEDPESLVWQLASELGMEVLIRRSHLEGNGGTVVFYQLWEGRPLFSCQITASFQQGRLVSLSGRLLMVEKCGEEHGQLLTLPTALLRFMDEILASGDVCSELVSMEPGYRMVQSFSSAMQLEPVWFISSNTADYYMDAVSGELSRLTEG